MGKTSKERMKKLRERRRNDASCDIENHRKKKWRRIANLRKKQKVQRSQDQKLTRNAMRCNNRNDLLYLSFTLKISIF